MKGRENNVKIKKYGREMTEGAFDLFEGFEVLRDAKMSEYTTLKLGGPADWLAQPGSPEDVAALFREADAAGIPVTVIGQGSNLLVLDGGIRGLVIKIGRRMSVMTARGNRMRVQAGAMLGQTALAAAAAGLSGLEFAGGIPGTVGGGAVMNAGAYDGQMADVVEEVTCLTRAGEKVVLGREELAYGYRRSAIPDRELTVTDVLFRLSEGDPKEIRARISELNARRAEKQPLDVPSAGSTFKRPEGAYAAALIDQCGLKGYVVGGAMVSPKHAGFLVNTGGSSADYLGLVRHVQKTVEERTGIRLETEIRILGEES